MFMFSEQIFFPTLFESSFNNSIIKALHIVLLQTGNVWLLAVVSALQIHFAPAGALQCMLRQQKWHVPKPKGMFPASHAKKKTDSTEVCSI